MLMTVLSKKLKEQKGFVLGYAFVIIGAVLAIGTALMLSGLAESKQSNMHSKTITSYYAAESGADIAYLALKNYITYINDEVAEKYSWTDIQNIKNYLNFLNLGPLGPPQGNEAVFHLNLSPNSDYYLNYSANPIPNDLGNGVAFQTNISLKSLGEASFEEVDGEEAITYLFKYLISSQGQDIGAVSGKNTVTGEGTVSVKFTPGSYSRFALFTDIHKDKEEKTDVWFSENTVFTGPVYTNDQLLFWKTPLFKGRVYSKSQTAKFYNNNYYFPAIKDADSNPPHDIPTFLDGFKRGVAGETLPKKLIDLRKVNLHDQVNNPPETGDYFFPDNASLKLTGGLYIPKSVEEVTFKADGNKQIVRVKYDSNKSRDFIFDYDSKTTTVRDSSNNSIIETINSLPNGTILVDGYINSFGGTIQKNSRLTLAAQNDIIITDHIRYEEDPRINPAAKNILGILSETGSVLLTHGPGNKEPPYDLVIHGTIMVPQGAFYLKNWMGIRKDKGTLTLLGGVISEYYGSIARIETDTLKKSGYGRDFIYDERMADIRKMPLGFPKTESLQYDTTREGKENTLDLIVWKKRSLN